MVTIIIAMDALRNIFDYLIIFIIRNLCNYGVRMSQCG